MPDELPSLLPRVGESHSVDDIVEPGFQNLEEIVAGHASAPLGLDKVFVKLALHNTIEPTDLLLLAKLEPELRWSARSALSVLTWRKIFRGLALHDRALRPVAARTLQIELHTLAPAQPAYGSRISRHV